MRLAEALHALSRFERRLPLLAPAAGVWAGAAFLGRFPLACPGAALLAALFFVFARRRAFVLAALFVAGAATGGTCRLLARSRGCPAPGAPAGPAVAVVDRIDGEPDGRTSLTLTLRALQTPAGFSPVSCRVLASTGRRAPLVSEGDTVYLPSAAWAPPAHLVNPGTEDSAASLLAEGIRRVASLPDGAGFLVLSPAPSWRRFFAVLRRRFLSTARAGLPAGPARAALLSIAAGDQDEIAPEERDRFVEAGLSHLLSPGGLDLALLLLALHAALARLWARSERLLLLLPAGRAADALCLPWPFSWALLSGGHAAALRAAGIATTFLVARLLGRGRQRGAHLWSAAAMVGFCLFPGAALDGRLLLIALLLAGLWGLGPPLARLLGGSRDAGLARQVLGRAAGFTIAGWIAGLPLAAAFAHRISLLSLPAQMIGLPLAAAVPIAVLPAFVALAVSPHAGPLLVPPFVLARALAALASLAGNPGARLVLPDLPAPVWIALGLATTATAAALRGFSRARPFAAGASLVALLGIGLSRFPPPGLSITFLSVGQGDSEVIELPGGEALVVDGGGSAVGSFDPGRRIVAPFLWSRGIGKLAAAALSHPHPDHANGLAYLFSSFAIGEFWATAQPCPLLACKEIDRIVTERGIARRLFTREDHTLTIEGVRIDALYPLAPAGFFPDLADNDNSLVLRVSWRGFTALLPGDIEAEGEARLTADPTVDLSADVLKAPHHGSDTSSGEKLVRRVHPRAVVFCVGPANRFGFPRESIVQRWREAGARTFRTDEDGAVTFRTPGSGFTVETARPGLMDAFGEPGE